tara:strand:- start:76 stop:351 length:276 start_codon:yes stop_codon:yes gene_type:complete
MIGKAINKLAVAQDETMRWSYDGFITNETEFNNISVEDDKSFNFTWADVQAKATELEAEENAKGDVKASAKTKLMAGEALTEEEANELLGL